MKQLFCTSIVVVGSILGTWDSSASVVTINLEPHRAIYDVVLSKSTVPNTLLSANGRLVLELFDACDGYIFNQRFVIRWAYDEGKNFTSDYVAAAWESKSGREFRFDSTTKIDGQLTEHYRGDASIPETGENGRVKFSHPYGLEDLALAPGTVFPGAHIRTLIERARMGNQRFSSEVYDGNGPNGLFQAVSFLGAEIAKDPSAEVPLIRDVVSWPVRIAYYASDVMSGVPELEIGYRLYANGVGSSYLIDYGGIVLEGKLVSLDSIGADC